MHGGSCIGSSRGTMVSPCATHARQAQAQTLARWVWRIPVVGNGPRWSVVGKRWYGVYATVVMAGHYAQDARDVLKGAERRARRTRTPARAATLERTESWERTSDHEHVTCSELGALFVLRRFTVVPPPRSARPRVLLASDRRTCKVHRNRARQVKLRHLPRRHHLLQ